MIEICQLTKRRVDPNTPMPHHLEQLKLFCSNVGHGIGKVDFVEKVAEISQEDYDDIVDKSGKYTKFKLGNLTRYFEIEIYKEHVEKLKDDMVECDLKKRFLSLKEGFFVIRKKI
jgi:hypothetical protein